MHSTMISRRWTMNDPVTVPLVVYVNGERKVIGQAAVSKDGGVAGVIHEPMDETVRDLFRIYGGEFSIRALNEPVIPNG